MNSRAIFISVPGKNRRFADVLNMRPKKNVSKSRLQDGVYERLRELIQVATKQSRHRVSLYGKGFRKELIRD
jgi:hypothetical protein